MKHFCYFADNLLLFFLFSFPYCANFTRKFLQVPARFHHYWQTAIWSTCTIHHVRFVDCAHLVVQYVLFLNTRRHYSSRNLFSFADSFCSKSPLRPALSLFPALPEKSAPGVLLPAFTTYIWIAEEQSGSGDLSKEILRNGPVNWPFTS